MTSALSKDDLKAIETKIAEVEKKTAGEIVVHVVGRSDDYAAVRLGWAVVIAALCAKVLSYEFGGVFGALSLELAAALTVVLWLVFGLSAPLGWLVTRALKRERVHRRAQAAFIENRVHRTRDASGVLILVSLFERRVEILADEGIHARVGVAGWQSHVKLIIDCMKKGEPAKGIVECIEHIGKELTDMVPIRPDDENELSNEVVVSPR